MGASSACSLSSSAKQYSLEANRVYAQINTYTNDKPGGNPLAKFSPNDVLSKKGTQLAGLLLWRFGLALAGATALYRTTKFLLKFIDLPLQLEIGIGFIFCGAVLFLVSMIMERIVDMQSEGDLTQ